jgi:hypothetical protein
VASSRFTANTGAYGNNTTPGNITGTSVYDSIGESLPTPAPEMLQELRVNTAMYDASQGSKAGAQIAAITRSGTNAFHGQAYDYFQNNIFDAAEFFRNANSSISVANKVEPLHYNRFGATLGGPIKKDKLFFFVAYQGVRDTDSTNGTQNITVPLHLTDDRSPAALAQVAQLDFGKTIAPSQMDQAAVKLLNYKIGNQYLIPSPSITDPATALRLGYDAILQAPATFNVDQGAASIDYNFSDKDRLAAKFFDSYNPIANPLSSGSSTFGFPQVNQSGSGSFVLDNTTMVTPTLTWEQKASVSRMFTYVRTQQPLSAVDAGIQIFGGTTPFPSISISTMDNTLRKGFNVGASFSNANAGTYQNQWEWASTLNWVRGRHTIGVGFSWDREQLNIVNNANNVASIGFGDFTNFLTGTLTPSRSRYTLGASNRYYRADLAGAFVQDKIKVTSTLNVSLGLRYDFSGPLAEKYGALTNFHPGAYSYDPATDTVTNTGLVVAGNNSTLGTPGVNDSTLTGRQWGIGPRIGIAWSPSQLNNVVIRAGFGMFYDRGEYFTEFSPGFGQNGISGPFGVTLAPPFVQQVNAVSGGTLSTPFAGAVLPPPVTSQSAFANLIPNTAQLRKGATAYTFGGYDPSNVLPYTEEWSLDLQWQPLNSLQLSLGYVGNRSLHQVLPIPFNEPGIATPSNPIHGEVYSYGFNILPAENVNTFDGGNTDLRVPYIGYSANSVFYKTEGIASYNGLQFGLRKRLSKGLQITAGYTWSHSLDEQSGLGLFYNGNDPLNPRTSYATSTYDRTHVTTVQYLYQFPNAARENSIVGKIADGWALSGITVLQSGFPYNPIDYSGVVGSIYYSHNVNIIDPVIPLKPGVTVAQATLQGTTGYNINKPFVDSNGFYVPAVAPGQMGAPPCATVNGNQVCDTFETAFGDTSRNIFRAPFQFRADVTVSKLIRIGEKVSLKYQADFFNIFNHPTFDAPNVSASQYFTNFSTNVPTYQGFRSSFGLIQNTIGSPRLIQMALHLVF